MSDTAKPEWRDVADHPDWWWVADAPGQIVKFHSASHDRKHKMYKDAETEATQAWEKGIIEKYGRENVTAGEAANPGPNCPFALYARRSALT